MPTLCQKCKSKEMTTEVDHVLIFFMDSIASMEKVKNIVYRESASPDRAICVKNTKKLADINHKKNKEASFP